MQADAQIGTGGYEAHRKKKGGRLYHEEERENCL